MTRATRGRGDARSRVRTAAIALFSQHGVGGTSLQMIADEIGVSKAAVYHQFPTKDGIVLAVVAPVLEHIDHVVAAAEAGATPRARFDALVDGLVDVVIEQRQAAAFVQSDPAVRELLGRTDTFLALSTRMDAVLIGPEPSDEARIALATAGGGLMIAGVDPALAAMPVEAVRRVLAASVRAVLAPYAPV
ncbi:TetR/AcrR family transcriptional regulator [Agromyces atrinae]|uniref:AcrR family transcriptional regulator n=1 Tax=Agromyces atrinae TaxID=592376 RepID=A0A4Q2M2P4_9MICO|nr:TetR/AcrR family transcriptional regulator [Agromyces atrinae]NYD68668.1 AcrR family transcriptional regulator [Agromyces atrinae]RXZ86038.1 TetR/AcrR family transcriptional regulator [Agromyces atrinae]